MSIAADLTRLPGSVKNTVSRSRPSTTTALGVTYRSLSVLKNNFVTLLKIKLFTAIEEFADQF